MGLIQNFILLFLSFPRAFFGKYGVKETSDKPRRKILSNFEFSVNPINSN